MKSLAPALAEPRAKQRLYAALGFDPHALLEISRANQPRDSFYLLGLVARRSWRLGDELFLAHRSGSVCGVNSPSVARTCCSLPSRKMVNVTAVPGCVPAT